MRGCNANVGAKTLSRVFLKKMERAGRPDTGNNNQFNSNEAGNESTFIQGNNASGSPKFFFRKKKKKKRKKRKKRKRTKGRSGAARRPEARAPAQTAARRGTPRGPPGNYCGGPLGPAALTGAARRTF